MSNDQLRNDSKNELIMVRNFTLVIVSLCLFATCLSAQQINKYTISGYVVDRNTGETLIGANVYLSDDPNSGTTSNTYGFYSLRLPEGKHTLVYSYLGYAEIRKTVELDKDIRVNIDMVEGIEIEEVLVTAKEENEAVEGTQMGRIELPVDQIKNLPVLFGEVDILKTIQLLPGVSSVGEGTSGFYVRGGGSDQNLVLLDEAIVYNTGHLLGFFSVFNADAIKNTTLIKGNIPAQYGGRLSSVVDVQMKEGNDQNYEVEGGIGLISSRITAQGPDR